MLAERCGCVLEATGEAAHLLASNRASASKATSLCSPQGCGIQFTHCDYIAVCAHLCYHITFWFGAIWWRLFETGWRQRISFYPACHPSAPEGMKRDNESTLIKYYGFWIAICFFGPCLHWEVVGSKTGELGCHFSEQLLASMRRSTMHKKWNKTCRHWLSSTSAMLSWFLTVFWIFRVLVLNRLKQY